MKVSTPMSSSVKALKLQQRGERRPRKYLAELFDRTESQIRDDLTAAQRRGFLEMSTHGARTRQEGPAMKARKAAKNRTIADRMGEGLGAALVAAQSRRDGVVSKLQTHSEPIGQSAG
jgi:hypothetical protein